MKRRRHRPDDSMFDAMSGIEDAVIRRERAKARQLRKSRWWQQKVSAGICHYCRRQFPPGLLTMDHLVPLARGGKSTKGNLVPCCKSCNNAKKISLPVEMESLDPLTESRFKR